MKSDDPCWAPDADGGLRRVSISVSSISGLHLFTITIQEIEEIQVILNYCVGWDAYTHHQRQVDLMLVYAVKQTETVRQLSRKVCFIQKMRKLTNIFQYYYWLNGDKSSQELNNLNFICEIFRQAYSHVLHARRFGERMCLRRTLYTWTAEFFIIIIIIIIACHRQSINSSMTWPTLV